ncbi:MAG: hypothetical protein ACRDBH_04620 [Bosea sp. (in: a-proteobacteria)]
MQYPTTNRDMKDMGAAGSVLDPIWKEGKNDSDPPSNSDLDAQAKKTARRLLKQAEAQASRQLRTTASSISQGSIPNKANGLFKSCETSACPREDARRQRFLTAEIYRLIVEKELPARWVLLSVVSEIGKVEPEDLTKIGPRGGTSTCKAVQEHLINVLNEARVRHAIAALDIVYRTDKRKKGELGFKGSNFPDHWLIHITVMLSRKDYLRAKKLLQEAYPVIALISKPLKASNWDGNPKMIAYVLKRLADVSADLCRETYLREKQGEGTPRRNTRLVKLSARQRNDLTVMLDQLAPECRYLMWGLRPADGENGLTIELDN